MQAPLGMPARERERLAELHALDLADHTGDARVEQLTRLAADLFEVPVALVTLIDEKRQSFLARCGLDEIEGTSRDDAFCDYTIERDELLVVPDATADRRFADNPLVTGEPFIRFYAGAVLRGPNGHALGSLCLIDYVARRLEEREQRQLVRLARVVESLLLDRGAGGTVTAGNERPALHDEETGLELRGSLQSRLQTLLAEASGPPIAVLAVYIEGLGDLRAALGVESGDRIIATLAERFGHVLPRQATVGRWDSAEFLVVTPVVPGIEPGELADRIADAAESAVEVGDSTVKRSVSIGVAASPEDGDDPDVLITQARGAARDASGRRRGGSKITAGQAAYDARRQIALGRRLAEAIGEQRIEPRYQPRLRVADGRIVGAEALARWEDEELGPVSPAEFIPVAERAGLIGDLTHAIMDAAIARASQWRAEGNADFRIGVNLSGADLLDPGLVDRVTDMLERREIGGDILELEITEGALVADIRRAERQMHALAELGVRFAIDDFGTGYSSFQYLRELPVDQVKVDRSFVRDIAGNANDAAILQAITAMAGALGLEVVAEGVEDAEQLRLLRAWRCNQAQGFLFAPAVPAPRFGELLREGLTEAAPTS